MSSYLPDVKIYQSESFGERRRSKLMAPNLSVPQNPPAGHINAE